MYWSLSVFQKGVLSLPFLLYVEIVKNYNLAQPVKHEEVKTSNDLLQGKWTNIMVIFPRHNDKSWKRTFLSCNPFSSCHPWPYTTANSLNAHNKYYIRRLQEIKGSIIAIKSLGLSKFCDSAPLTMCLSQVFFNTQCIKQMNFFENVIRE